MKPEDFNTKYRLTVIPPNTTLRDGSHTYQWHLFFETKQEKIYTQDEAAHVLAGRLHPLRDDSNPFLPHTCKPLCAIWQAAKDIISHCAAGPRSMEFGIKGKEVFVLINENQTKDIDDAIRTIGTPQPLRIVAPAPTFANVEKNYAQIFTN